MAEATGGGAAAPAASSGAGSSSSSSDALAIFEPVQATIDETIQQFEMFSTRKPRNLMAGTSSGLKSVAKGVVTGAVGLVAAPVAGAKAGGVQGFFMGLASGLFSAVALPVAGAAVGAFQVGRGAVNSVESSIEAANGKDWDQERREWYNYDLSTDAAKVRGLDENDDGDGDGGGGAGSGRSSSAGGGGGSGKKPADTTFYDLLGVPYDASTDVIKKAYYKKAPQLRLGVASVSF